MNPARTRYPRPGEPPATRRLTRRTRRRLDPHRPPERRGRRARARRPAHRARPLRRAGQRPLPRRGRRRRPRCSRRAAPPTTATAIYVSTGSQLWSNRSRASWPRSSTTPSACTTSRSPRAARRPSTCSTRSSVAPRTPRASPTSCDALAPYGVDPDRIGTTLNVFMDVWTDERGRAAHRPATDPARVTASPSRRGCRWSSG